MDQTKLLTILVKTGVMAIVIIDVLIAKALSSPHHAADHFCLHLYLSTLLPHDFFEAL